MANQRISKDKQVFILAALAEGTPINAIARMFQVGKHAVLRVIEETGEAISAYMRSNFRDLPCQRIELDEQWQYVGMHGQRMAKKEKDRGDFWLWCALDSDTKLVFSHIIGGRDRYTGEWFMDDVAARVRDGVQIAADSYRLYPFLIAGAFGQRQYSFGTEAKVFVESEKWNPSEGRKNQKNGIPKIAKAERAAVAGCPDLGTLTRAHVERVFLSFRQELTRFTRRTLGYSKDLRMHKLAVALHIGIYNLVRKHKGLDGQTPAQAAGVEERRWSMEDVVAMTEAYWAPKREEEAALKAKAKRAAEDDVFLKALASFIISTP